MDTRVHSHVSNATCEDLPCPPEHFGAGQWENKMLNHHSVLTGVLLHEYEKIGPWFVLPSS